jgi:integrase
VKAGLPDAHFHDLRHAGLTLSAQAGATLAEVMRRAGHSSAAAAMRYQHAADQRDTEIAARLSALAQDRLQSRQAPRQ